MTLKLRERNQPICVLNMSNVYDQIHYTCICYMIKEEGNMITDKELIKLDINSFMRINSQEKIYMGVKFIEKNVKIYFCNHKG